MPNTRVTDEEKATFLQGLAEGLSVTGAAERTGRTRRAFYAIAKRDEEFAQDRAETIDDGTERLEDEARRRALEGTEKPIYQGGKRVGSVKEYSDTLLIFLLKARNPAKYRDRHELEVSGGVSVSLVNFTGDPIGKHGPDQAPAIEHTPTPDPGLDAGVPTDAQPSGT